MIRIDYEGTAFECAEKWSELSLGKLQRILSVKHETSTELEASAEIVSIMTDISPEMLDELPYTEFIKLANATCFILEECKEKPRFEVEILGTEYVMSDDITKYSTAEYIDLDSMVKDKDNIAGNLHVIMAIMYREKKNGRIVRYDSNSLAARADLFKEHMTCDCALSAMLFSAALGLACLECIPGYSANKNVA